MTDFRIKEEETRMEYFLKYYHWSLKFYDCDSSLFLMNYVNKRLELNYEQRIWFSWIYANTYNLASSLVIWNEFPDFENVSLERLTIWNTENFKRLRYQVDQKWQKGHLPKMFGSYKEQIGDKTQFEFFDQKMGNSGVENFNNLYKTIVKNFFKFGRYSAWFYLQTLKETCDFNLEPPSLLLEDDNTHAQRDGLCYAVGMDEWVGDKTLFKDKKKISFLNKKAEEILYLSKELFPELRPDYFNMETTLCAFKKTFRRSKGRYLGYYLDRQFEDIKRVQDDNWDGIDWDLLWDGRNEILDKRTNRNTGVIQEDMEFFLNTGKVKNLEFLYEK